jgi:uncharacterized protein (TIGR01777 family)
VPGPAASVKVLVSGSHGLIGTALIPALAARGHEVVRLVRTGGTAAPGSVRWDPDAPGGGQIDTAALEGIDAAIHLAGESVAGRWTAAKKARIRESRVRGTGILTAALAALARRPRVLLSASATGYYGDRGDELLIEESQPGRGFLADVCRAWEAAAAVVERAGIRAVFLRTGVVLAPRGGALARLLPVFRRGLGGPLGSGRQFMSWITLDDEVAAIVHLLEGETRGPVNLVSPHPVTNREFTAALARALRRPALLPAPAAALRIVLGELAGELLASQRVHPAVLLGTRFAFRHPDLDTALGSVLAQVPGAAPAR